MQEPDPWLGWVSAELGARVRDMGICQKLRAGGQRCQSPGLLPDGVSAANRTGLLGLTGEIRDSQSRMGNCAGEISPRNFVSSRLQCVQHWQLRVDVDAMSRPTIGELAAALDEKQLPRK